MSKIEDYTLKNVIFFMFQNLFVQHKSAEVVVGVVKGYTHYDTNLQN